MAATGGVDQITEVDLPRPLLLPRDVLIRVIAAGLNPVDAKVRSGFGNPGPVSAPKVMGYDCAGIVQAIGPEVTAFKVRGRASAHELLCYCGTH